MSHYHCLVKMAKDLKDGLDRMANIEDIRPFLTKIHQTYNINYIAFTEKILTIKETAYRISFYQINSNKLKQLRSIS